MTENTDYAAESDEALVERVQSGDHKAFGVLVRRYEDKIARYGRKFLRVQEDREDLLQDIFLKAYVNIMSFDAKRRFSPWLYRIAHNEFINALKKLGRAPMFSFGLDTLLPHPVAPETADGETERRELSEEMNSCMEELPVKYSEPIILRYFESLSYQEISDILHIPISTVGVRVARGKEQLRNIYNKKYGKH